MIRTRLPERGFLIGLEAAAAEVVWEEEDLKVNALFLLIFMFWSDKLEYKP